jgi:hypothetical protein
MTLGLVTLLPHGVAGNLDVAVQLVCVGIVSVDITGVA